MGNNGVSRGPSPLSKCSLCVLPVPGADFILCTSYLFCRFFPTISWGFLELGDLRLLRGGLLRARYVGRNVTVRPLCKLDAKGIDWQFYGFPRFFGGSLCNQVPCSCDIATSLVDARGPSSGAGIASPVGRSIAWRLKACEHMNPDACE